ncbi:unnamed protein product [Calicophoron daubneyi]|uniref:t-SNARE coiled-coil homology domain-containing protein n=1 Tax=Calicophoron daubneyi TaxID=300641 RepID=A0AAV2TN29_CALDB
MTSAVDRTADFVQSVQLVRSSRKLVNGIPNFRVAPDGGPVYQKLKSDMIPPPYPNGHVVPVDSQKNPASKRKAAIHRHSEFTQMAASIGRDLAATFGKLEQLNALARRQTLFDDHSSEIQRLSYVVKEDMADLNHRIAKLQSLSKSQDSTGKQQATHSHSVLMGLQTRLARMSNQFRSMLEQRSENLRTQAARRGKYTSMRPVAGDSVAAGAAQPQSVVIPSVLLRDDERARQEALSGEDGLRDSVRPRPDLEPDVKLAQQLSLVDQTDAYLASRADTMRSIEHTIVELGEIFQQLATMVHEQDESIRRIDANVDDAALSVEAGHSELVRYLRSISSNRWLMIKVFGVLLIFFVIFVVFFV